jgi:hypothetical protein
VAKLLALSSDLKELHRRLFQQYLATISIHTPATAFRRG